MVSPITLRQMMESNQYTDMEKDMIMKCLRGEMTEAQLFIALGGTGALNTSKMI